MYELRMCRRPSTGPHACLVQVLPFPGTPGNLVGGSRSPRGMSSLPIWTSLWEMAVLEGWGHPPGNTCKDLNPYVHVIPHSPPVFFYSFLFSLLPVNKVYFLSLCFPRQVNCYFLVATRQTGFNVWKGCSPPQQGGLPRQMTVTPLASGLKDSSLEGLGGGGFLILFQKSWGTVSVSHLHPPPKCMSHSLWGLLCNPWRHP